MSVAVAAFAAAKAAAILLFCVVFIPSVLLAEAKEALTYVNECMRWRPSWATTLPLACELGMGVSYDECGKKKPIELWGV